jgi:hypothetical protein
MARIDAVEGRFQLSGPFGRYTTHPIQDPVNRTRPLYFDWEMQGFVNEGPDYVHLMPNGTFLPFDGSLHVGGAQHQKTNPDSGTRDERLTVKWGAMSVSPAFDNKIGR